MCEVCVAVHHLFPVLQREKDTFLDHILGMDMSWMHSFDPELKWQSAKWESPISS